MTRFIKSPHQFLKYCEFGDEVIGYDDVHTQSVQQEAGRLMRSDPNAVFHLVAGVATVECSECPRYVDGEIPGKRRNSEFSPCDPITDPGLYDVNEDARNKIEAIFGKTKGITAGDYQNYRRCRR